MLIEFFLGVVVEVMVQHVNANMADKAVLFGNALTLI
jgi:hypothetical protein